MSITITEKDIGRNVLQENGVIRSIAKWDANDALHPVRLSQSFTADDKGIWFRSDGTNMSGAPSIVGFADEPETTKAELTEDRVREIIREMMQPQPEKPEPQRGECWVNVYRHHLPHACETREDADRQSGPERIACVKIEWTEGQGLEETQGK